MEPEANRDPKAPEDPRLDSSDPEGRYGPNEIASSGHAQARRRIMTLSRKEEGGASCSAAMLLAVVLGEAHGCSCGGRQ